MTALELKLGLQAMFARAEARAYRRSPELKLGPTSDRTDSPQAKRATLTVRERATTISTVAVPRITKEDLKQRFDAGSVPVLIDARLKYPYEHSTVKLPGAIRFTGDGPAPGLPRDQDIVVYDSDPYELASSRVAGALIRQGYRASSLKGGIAEWLSANLPTETKEAPKQAAPEPGALKG